ncbi:MAG: sialidase family protein [Nitrosotalea sp.]
MKILSCSITVILFAVTLGIVIVVAVIQPASAQEGRIYFGSQQPQIVTSGNNLSITWQYWNPERQVNLIASHDSGTTLSGKITLMKSSTMFSSFSSTLGPGNDVYYVWWNYSLPYTPRLFFVKSADDGTTFGNPVLLVSHDTHSDESVELDNLFASGNNVYIIWSTYREVGSSSFGTVFLSKSADRGQTFDNQIAINEPDTSWYGLETATSENMTYFMWQSLVPQSCILGQCKSQIHIRPMNSDGILDSISNTIIRGNILQAKIAASGNNVYITGVLFQPNSTFNIVNGLKVSVPTASSQWVFFSKSHDGGTTFGGIENISGSSFYCIPSVMNYQCNLGTVHPYASGDTVYVIWDESAYADNTIKAFLVGSTNGGNTFGKTVQLTPYGFDDMVCSTLEQCVSVQFSPAPDNAVYLVWVASNLKWSSSGHVIFAKSTDGGKTLDYSDVTNSTGIELSPVVAAGPDNTVYLTGLRPGFPEGNHVFFSKSADGGNSFDRGVDLDMLQEMPVPEFPFVVPVLLIGIVSMIIFYRIRIAK